MLTINVDSTAADGTPLTTKAFVSSAEPDPNTANNTALETTQVVAVADLKVTKTAAADAFAGNNLVYTVKVTNQGPSDNTGFTVSDVLASGTSFVSASPDCADSTP